jgi:hypothetical protein
MKHENLGHALIELGVVLRAVPARYRLDYARKLRAHAAATMATIPADVGEEMTGAEWSAALTVLLAAALDASVTDDANGLDGKALGVNDDTARG